jgi:hypothetical protein
MAATLVTAVAMALIGAACGGAEAPEESSSPASNASGSRAADPAQPTSTSAALPASVPTSSAPSTGASTTAAPSTAAPTNAATPSPKASFEQPPVVLVWGSGRLRSDTIEAVGQSDGIKASTVVSGGSLGLVASTDADGEEVDRTSDGDAIPLDTLAYDAATYRPFVSSATADALEGLGPGDAALGATSAELRGFGVGGRLTLDSGRTLTVRAVLPDAEVAGAEVVVAPGTATEEGIGGAKFLLARPSGTLDEGAEAVRSATSGGPALRVRTSEDARWLRHADAVAPQALIKRDFGEFAVAQGDGREVSITPEFADANIVTESVPLLGEVRCHRSIIEPLREALGDLEKRGLAEVIDRSGYSGCFYPRRISPKSDLSRHSWGIALDLNIAGDARGRDVDFAPELVEAMAKVGFRSGADWLVPDPAHFEFYPEPTPG